MPLFALPATLFVNLENSEDLYEEVFFCYIVVSRKIATTKILWSSTAGPNYVATNYFATSYTIVFLNYFFFQKKQKVKKEIYHATEVVALGNTPVPTIQAPIYFPKLNYNKIRLIN